MEDDIKFTFTETHTNYSPEKIKVIGVGGGGNNAITHMYNMGVRNVSFIVANTDQQALNNTPVPTKVLLGPNVTRGRGAGNVPEKARLAAEESAEEINELFDDDTDMVFITAGMGGGTGTGASPVIARIARERGLLTIGIVTIPFLFEGRRKIMKALQGAQELSKYVDALLVINNDRLSEIYKDCNFLNAFGKADDILSMAAISISEIITCDGYINLDFNDVDNTLREGGTAIISTGYGEGENRVTKAIEDALHSPLLKNTDIFGSKKLLFNLYFSDEAEQEFLIEETKQITAFISKIENEVDVIWGVSIDKSLGDKVKFTILAAGFDVSLSGDNTSTQSLGFENESIDLTNGRTDKTTDRPVTNKHTETKAAENVDDKKTNDILEKYYGSEKVEDLNSQGEKNKYFILNPGQLDDDDAIDTISSTSPLQRDKRKIGTSINTTHPDNTGKTNQAPDNGGGKNINFSDLY